MAPPLKLGAKSLTQLRSECVAKGCGFSLTESGSVLELRLAIHDQALAASDTDMDDSLQHLEDRQIKVMRATWLVQQDAPLTKRLGLAELQPGLLELRELRKLHLMHGRRTLPVVDLGRSHRVSCELSDLSLLIQALEGLLPTYEGSAINDLALLIPCPVLDQRLQHPGGAADATKRRSSTSK